jgi:glyoxylase-like metal-dependent hydrolase (beta-lactamase superfamily II)
MNKGIFSLIVCVFALLLIQTGVAGEEILIRAEKLTDCVLVLRAGNNPQNPNVTAVATDKGIVVIDSHMAPSIALKMRRRMEQEFGRDDFVYLINTHHHFDHSNGNQAFPEALVIGQTNAPAAYPESVRSWSGLGEALLRQGKKEDARAALQQALKLDPDNEELIRRLKEIKEPPNITQ